MTHIFFRLSTLMMLISLFASCKTQQMADLVILNGYVWTADSSIQNANNIACLQGKIITVTDSIDIKNYIDSQTKIIDARGHFVMPGLIEGHGHFSGLGYSLIELNLLKTKSWEEIQEKVSMAVKKSKPGEWIVGRGWHQEKWDSLPRQNLYNYPFHETLSQLSPDNPVLLFHASGHSLFANKKAMDIAGVSKETQNPEGGHVVKRSNGEPIGVFEERAMQFISSAYKEYKKSLDAKSLDSIWHEAIHLASLECLKNGITSFQDAGSSFVELEKYEKLALNQQLNVRLWAMARQPYKEMEPVLANYKKIGVGNQFYTCNAIKSEVDGALGAFGAWLLKPYDDKPGFMGQNTTDIYDVKKIADLAIKNDMQFCVHAIGDRANRVVLDIYEGIKNQHPNKMDWRWRIEHAQHLDTADIPRFSKLGIIASMQGVHCTSDAPFVVKRLGSERAKIGAYAWRSLLDNGVIIANGTDAPVEDVNPFYSIYASVTRKTIDSKMDFFPEQKMTRQEALISYTLGNAYAAFEESFKGSITPGKVADIVILDNNLLTCDEDKILQTKVLYTILDGKVTYIKP
ncbi:MAG: amidohydrolase family protein [Saprospiraceae bacterium]